MCIGFTELEREDRATLFKQGSFEVIVTRYTRLFTSEGMFTPDMTVMIPRSEFNSSSFRIFTSPISCKYSLFRWGMIHESCHSCAALAAELRVDNKLQWLGIVSAPFPFPREHQGRFLTTTCAPHDAIFDLGLPFDFIGWCLENFVMVSLTFQELSCWQTDKQSYRQTLRWKQYNTILATLRCAGGNH